jgi:hypothetical protein
MSDSKKITASYFTEAIGADSYVSDSILSGSECDIIYAKDNKANIISYRFDATHREPALLNILHFLNNLVE